MGDVQAGATDLSALDPDEMSPAELLAIDPDAAERFVSSLPEAEVESLPYAWSFWRRPDQVMPERSRRWKVWTVRAGRGYGKTRTGAESVRAEVEGGRVGRVGLIAPTAADGRDVMIEGESGLLAVHPPWNRPDYEPSKRRVTWENGAIATIYSAEEPDRLRGPQHDLVWGDEPASWKTGDAAWVNAMFGLRLGRDPKAILTGTPRPLAWLRELERKRSTVVSTGSTYRNLANLAESFIELVLGTYEGTRLGQQELWALYLDTTEGALWSQVILDTHRVHGWLPSPTQRIVIGVDPPGETAECGIIVAAGPRRPDPLGHAFMLDDRSLAGPPEQWGQQVVATWRHYRELGIPVKVVVESNQGGDMTRATIHNVDADCPVHKIRAGESKSSRAEPVSTATQRGRVHLVGYWKRLEDQLTTWVPGPRSKSPDRLDAFVHAVTDLIPARATAKVRASSPARGSLGRQATM